MKKYNVLHTPSKQSVKSGLIITHEYINNIGKPIQHMNKLSEAS